jgi:hypothetical protein
MNTYMRMQQATDSQFFRWCGRASGAAMIAVWLFVFVAELFRAREVPSSETYLQAAALVVVFGGYVIGWLSEPIGGWMAILGTVVFFVVCRLTLTSFPQLEASLLALPGACYLLAHHFDRVENPERENNET